MLRKHWRCKHGWSAHDVYCPQCVVDLIAEGRRRERAEVVEHLQTAAMFGESPVIGATLRLAAEAIEAGEHSEVT